MERGTVALYGGGGAPFHHAAVLAAAGHRVEFVFPADILNGCLQAFDAFVMPGGGYRAMSGQIDPLGREGARAIREFVHAGRMYLGSCAGSYDAATVPASFVAACPAQADMCLLPARIWNETTTSWVGLQSPGVGVVRVRNVNPSHPIMEGMPDSFLISHYNGPLFNGAEALTVIEGQTEQFTPAERFLGPANGPTLIEDAARQAVANIVVGPHGNGRVVLFGSHPEFGFSLAMDDPQASNRMLDNAVRWQIAETGARRGGNLGLIARESALTGGDLVARARTVAARVCERSAELRARGTQGAAWLEPRYSMSTFGLSPAQIWQLGLDEIVRLAQTVERVAPSVEPWALAFRQPVEWDIDGGFHGVIALLEQTEGMLE
ncbi:MAG: hypothetical protein JWO59_890, partial [Chloroflexi bacterium]|nr:hypothetical protein [Chloroflexota bacterium]